MQGEGREDLTNLPRKINICVSPSRDDFPHTQINDLGLQAVQHPDSGEVLFNVEVRVTLGGLVVRVLSGQLSEADHFVMDSYVMSSSTRNRIWHALTQGCCSKLLLMLFVLLALCVSTQVGGHFSTRRNCMSIPAPFSVTQEQVVPFAEAVLKVGWRNDLVSSAVPKRLHSV